MENSAEWSAVQMKDVMSAVQQVRLASRATCMEFEASITPARERDRHTCMIDLHYLLTGPVDTECSSDQPI